MSEKESVLKKYTRLRNDLAGDYFELSVINTYTGYIERIKRNIETLNKRLSLDDNEFFGTFYQGDILSLVTQIRDDGRKILQGNFRRFLFEFTYGKYIKDEQIDPAIRNKLKEIGNKISEYRKDPLIQRFNNALENFEIKSDNLDDYINSFIKEIDGKLIKYFLEHE